MLLDKSYYDYDYEAVEEKSVTPQKPKSKREVSAMLSRFGFQTKIGTDKKKPLSPEELQAEVMAEIKDKKK